MVDFMPPLIPWLLFMGITSCIFALILAIMAIRLRNTSLSKSQRLVRDSLMLNSIAILAFVAAIIVGLLT